MDGPTLCRLGGETALVKKIIEERQIDVNARDSRGRGAIHLAAERGNLELVQILSSELHPSQRDTRAVLGWATWAGSSSVVEFLLENGYKPNGPSNVGHIAAQWGFLSLLRLFKKHGCLGPHDPTILHSAAAHGQEEAAAFLAEQSSHPDFKDDRGMTALHYAARVGNKSIVELLLNHDNIDLQGGSLSQTPLQQALMHDHREVARFLVNKGAQVDVVDSRIGWTLLHYVAKHGDLDTAKLLIDRSRELVNAQDWKVHWSPLHLATMGGHLEVARLLVQNGAAIDHADILGWTPGMFASLNGHSSVVRLVSGTSTDTAFDFFAFERWTNLHFAALDGQNIGALLNAKVTPKKAGHINMPGYSEPGSDADALRFNTVVSPEDYRAPDSVIGYAAEHGYDSLIKVLLDRGGDINTISPGGASSLHYAAAGKFKDPFRFAQYLINRGAKISVQDPRGEMPLHWAVKSGNRAMVELLLKRSGGANTRAFFRDLSPLHMAAKIGHSEIVDLLITFGAETTATTRDDETAVSLAVEGDHVAVIKLLHDRGVDLREIKFQGMSMLHYAVQLGTDKAAKFFLDGVCDVDEKTMDGWTPLHVAAWSGNDMAVTMLLDSNADIEAQDSRGSTPLDVATEHLCDSTRQVLIDRGALTDRGPITRTPIQDTHVIDTVQDSLKWRPILDMGILASYDVTELHVAARKGQVETVRRLLAGGAKASTRDDNKVTPLHLAALYGHLDVARLLVDAKRTWTSKSPTEQMNKNGITPLVYAAAGGHEVMVSYLIASMRSVDGGSLNYALKYAVIGGHTQMMRDLIANGAEVRYIDEKKRTLLHHAAENAHFAALQLLRDVDKAAMDENGRTALHFAAKSGSINLARNLIRHKDDVSVRDADRRTPLHYAAKYSNLAMLLFLREASSIPQMEFFKEHDVYLGRVDRFMKGWDI